MQNGCSLLCHESGCPAGFNWGDCRRLVHDCGRKEWMPTAGPAYLNAWLNVLKGNPSLGVNITRLGSICNHPCLYKYRGNFLYRREEIDACGSSHCGSAVTNPTRTREDAGSIPGLTQWVKDPALP